MFHVAVLAPDLGLVFASVRLNGCGLIRVADDTLRIGQRRLFRGRFLYMTAEYHKRHNDYTKDAEKSDSPFSA